MKNDQNQKKSFDHILQKGERRAGYADADLSGTPLEGALLTNANIVGAQLANADLSRVNDDVNGG